MTLACQFPFSHASGTFAASVPKQIMAISGDGALARDRVRIRRGKSGEIGFACLSGSCQSTDFRASRKLENGMEEGIIICQSHSRSLVRWGISRLADILKCLGMTL
ncbi:hypothetical protein BO83DRAFT_117716 [Aspergillus eucalypticola CBS 122712]|uniref:Uncharacterized protein n=1 Tax=Aspergillus eucalypticola (strain CBS 122712 / IBT 29274) TaxID=1448314 RepID=A0A317UUZ1_ASPEC|nr:uncharacterized protein BO83DRAFT_117716 [Aspergillus eucalypticola CBS 122712]PWY65853.1 hypothetical protein BO83DRAFT_117716 [Aspergillus eucalypticola CBS 122712]